MKLYSKMYVDLKQSVIIGLKKPKHVIKICVHTILKWNKKNKVSKAYDSK